MELFTDPGEEHHEGVEVEVALAVALRVIVSPDHGQHGQALGQEHHGAWTRDIANMQINELFNKKLELWP